MGRKTKPFWTLAEVIQLFNSAPNRILTKRQLMRATNASRHPEAWKALMIAIIYPMSVGSTAQFEISRDPKIRQTVIKMLDRGY